MISSEIENTTTFKDQVLSLGNEYDREYELRLTYMIMKGEIKENDLRAQIDAYRELLSNAVESEEQEKIAYAAFFALNILYRQSLDIEKLQELFNQNEVWCKKHKTFDHLRLVKCLHIPEELDGKEDEYLSTAYELAHKYYQNAGFVHLLANLYVVICEQNDDQQMSFRKKWGRKAENAIQDAIDLDPNYALYYCTKGRILSINGEYDLADNYFVKAIHKEQSSRTDYATRIGLYQSHRAQNQIKKTINTSRIQEQIDALRNANISNIEILSFFSGVVAFIIGSISLAKGQTAFDAAILITVFMGALLFAFAVFCFLLNLNTLGKGRVCIANIGVALLSAMIIAGGIYMVSMVK